MAFSQIRRCGLVSFNIASNKPVYSVSCNIVVFFLFFLESVKTQQIPTTAAPLFPRVSSLDSPTLPQLTSTGPRDGIEISRNKVLLSVHSYVYVCDQSVCVVMSVLCHFR